MQKFKFVPCSVSSWLRRGSDTIGKKFAAFERRWDLQRLAKHSTTSAFGTVLALASLFIPSLMMNREARADAPPKPQVYEVAPSVAVGVLISEEVAPNVRQVNIMVWLPNVGRYGVVNVGHLHISTWTLSYTTDPVNDPDIVQNNANYQPLGGLAFSSEEMYDIAGTLVPVSETGLGAADFAGYASFMQYSAQSGQSVSIGTMGGASTSDNNLLQELKEWATSVSFASAELRNINHSGDLVVAFGPMIILTIISIAVTVIGGLAIGFAWMLARRDAIYACNATTDTIFNNCLNMCMVTLLCSGSCQTCCLQNRRYNLIGCRSPRYTPLDFTATCILCP